MPSDQTRTFEKLEALLDKEKAILLDGRLDDLGHIARKKDVLINSRKLKTSNSNILSRIRQKADRNQLLLNAAISGLREVTTKLEALRIGPEKLNTYDQTGQRNHLAGDHKGALQRRA